MLKIFWPNSILTIFSPPIIFYNFPPKNLWSLCQRFRELSLFYWEGGRLFVGGTRIFGGSQRGGGTRFFSWSKGGLPNCTMSSLAVCWWLQVEEKIRDTIWSKWNMRKHLKMQMPYSLGDIYLVYCCSLGWSNESSYTATMYFFLYHSGQS